MSKCNKKIEHRAINSNDPIFIAPLCSKKIGKIDDGSKEHDKYLY